MDRIKTGIYGLDDVIEGGFPGGRTILVTGAAGTGKTIMGMQFGGEKCNMLIGGLWNLITCFCSRSIN